MKTLLVISAVLVACASSPGPKPVVVRANDPAALSHVDPNAPIVIEVMPGDEVPFMLKVEGDLVDTLPDQPKVMLRAKRHFFVRAGKEGLQLSLDGEHWDAKKTAPGGFSFGFGVSKEGPKASLTVTTPKFAE